MKRTAFITAATLLLLTGTAFNALAQNITTTVINDDTVTVTTGHIKDTTTHIKPKAWYSYFFETRMGADMLAYPTFATLDLAVAPGCTFRNGLSLRLPIEFNIGMNNGSGTYGDSDGTYMSTGTIGLNLGYDLLRKSDHYRLELNASGGSTYLKTPYRFGYADLSLKFGTKHLGVYNAYLGLNIRYIGPYNRDMTQKLMLGFTIGFWAF